MALIAAITSAFVACNQVTSGDPAEEEGLFGPVESRANLGDQGIGVNPGSWDPPISNPPFTSISGITTINGVASDGTTIVAVAGTSTNAYAATSTDGGDTWTTQSTALPALPRNPSTVNYIGNTYLVTAGNRATLGTYSASGSSWSITGTIGFGSKASAYGTAESLFVVGGQSGLAAYTPTLASNFTQIPAGSAGTGWPAATGPASYINAGAYGNGVYVFGGGSGRIAYTPTILSGRAIVPWETAEENPFEEEEFINVIVYGNGTFVAVGGPDAAPGIQGKAAYSTNGIIWTQATDFPLGTDVAVYALAYGNGYFVAGDDAGNIAYSSNGGASWTGPIDVFQGRGPINALTYDQRSDRFIAVGGTSSPMVAYTLNPSKP
jgi:hypothetical protein